MSIFTATFAAVAVSAAQDVFEIVAPSDTRVVVREIRLGQYSDAGDAAAELLGLTIIRGYTVSGSGGSTVTPANVAGHSGTTSYSGTVEANNTTVANTGTVQTMLADAFNVQAGWYYCPDEDERIQLDRSQRLVVRITAPADALTMNGTVVFETVSV